MSTAEVDEWLATLLEEWIEMQRDGRRPDVEEAIRSRPEYEQEIRELWATAMIAEELGSLSGLFAGLDSDSRAPTDAMPPAGSSFLPEAGPSLIARELPLRVGDYELLEELGRGGMGVVYKARQISLGRIVALKMILQGEWASQENIRRFRSEASALARLNHPNIASVYEAGDLDGQPFFAMEYIAGKTLGQRLADGPLPGREAATILVSVCQAIAHAHGQGILHRDLKVSNILIDRKGVPFVTDFGLAKVLSKRADESPEATHAGETHHGQSLTATGAILGTPSYMAPEQAAGRRGEVSELTDVYSLGALLYAMLTGRPPFQAANPVDTVLMVLEQDPLPPRLLNQKANPDLEMIALKCLQKPTDLRYDSASALERDLEAFLKHEPISARSSHFTQIVSRALRETHHAGVLENWGLLWMWHSLVLLVLCVITNIFQWQGVSERWPYVGLWVLGLGIWAGCFWSLRRRSGPITFVERQIAHVWAGSMVASSLLFGIEALLGFPVLKLSPVLGIISGMVFLAKAGILSGRFYIESVLLFATAGVMAVIQSPDGHDPAITLFGVMSALSFFLPGLKYYRQSLR